MVLGPLGAYFATLHTIYRGTCGTIPDSLHNVPRLNAYLRQLHLGWGNGSRCREHCLDCLCHCCIQRGRN